MIYFGNYKRLTRNELIMTNKGKIDDKIIKWIIDKNLDSTLL